MSIIYEPEETPKKIDEFTEDAIEEQIARDANKSLNQKTNQHIKEMEELENKGESERKLRSSFSSINDREGRLKQIIEKTNKRRKLRTAKKLGIKKLYDKKATIEDLLDELFLLRIKARLTLGKILVGGLTKQSTTLGEKITIKKSEVRDETPNNNPKIEFEEEISDLWKYKTHGKRLENTNVTSNKKLILEAYKDDKKKKIMSEAINRFGKILDQTDIDSSKDIPLDDTRKLESDEIVRVNGTLFVADEFNYGDAYSKFYLYRIRKSYSTNQIEFEYNEHDIVALFRFKEETNQLMDKIIDKLQQHKKATQNKLQKMMEVGKKYLMISNL